MVVVCYMPSLNAQVSNQTLAILVNENDPESIEIAKYYQRKRLIPESHIIYLKFKAQSDMLTEAEFDEIQSQLNEKVTGDIQAYALAWRKPWRVGCMSITSAFSLGYSKAYCATGCKLTRPTKYFNSLSHRPYTDFNIRPSMMLSAGSVEKVKKLIDKGVLADFTRPDGTAYLLSTSDEHRNVRSVFFSRIKKIFNQILNVDVLRADAIKNKTDILLYFTGHQKVRWVNENSYLPGAIADHLTSAGGHLFKGSQMSVLNWIDAGVTGTYGAVVEPCNFIQKFPRPEIVIQKYLAGNTLIEAYWKSVQMPGQGVFVGEPLASPYLNCKLMKSNQGYRFFPASPEKNFVERKYKNCI